MTAKLAHQTQKSAGIPNGMRTAIVKAVSGTAVTISVSGGTFSSGVGVLTSYAPVVGDVVAVFRQDSSWLILGPAVASPAGKWVKFASLGYQNGWTDRGVGFPFGAYRVAGEQVQIIGQVTVGSVQAAGNIIVSGLPAPPGEVAGIVATQGSINPSLHVDTGGNLRYYLNTGVTGVTGLMQFCSSYPLDFPAS